MKFLITGDLVVHNTYNTKDMIDESIIRLFSQSDYNMANLEAPVTKSNRKILKTGPHLKADKDSTLSVLESLSINLVTLANNHVLDYDEQGVKDTLDFCMENNIQTVGAGMNLKEASQILYIDTEEGRVAVVNFAENEWASATSDSAGANPMDIIDNAHQIQSAKKNADYVFVIVHGGHEYYNLPSPRMQKQYRFYAEQGADIVIGHHTHCISGNEIYKEVPIYYSLGNFLFTSDSQHEDWYNGLILEIEIKGRKILPKLYTIQQQKDSFRIFISNENKTFKRISEFNEIIKDSKQLYNNWDIYINKQSNAYLNYWSPLSFIRNRYIKAIFSRLNINFINRQGLGLYLNLMRCEAHSDMSKEVIKKFLKVKNNSPI